MKFISLFVLAYSSIVDALAYHSALTNEKPMSRRNVLGAAVVTSAASLLLGRQAQAAVDGNSDVDVDTQVYFGVGVGAEGCFFLFWRKAIKFRFSCCAYPYHQESRSHRLIMSFRVVFFSFFVNSPLLPFLGSAFGIFRYVYDHDHVCPLGCWYPSRHHFLTHHCCSSFLFGLHAPSFFSFWKHNGSTTTTTTTITTITTLLA